MALCMVSGTHRLRQTPTCQAAGVVTATGQAERSKGGQAERSQARGKGGTHAVTEGWEPATEQPTRAMPDPYLPGRTSDHQDCVPPRSWRHAGERREQDTESNVLSKADRRKD